MKIRPSRTSDAQSISRVYVQTWRDTYLSMVPYGYLYEMSTRRHERAFINELNSKQVISYVAEDAGRITGFVTGGRERHGNDIYSGEIYTLYVLKHLQRRGIGKKLVAALAAQLRQSNTHAMLVRVLKLNPYRRFYLKINGTYLKTEHQQFAGEILEVEVYSWLDTTLITC